MSITEIAQLIREMKLITGYAEVWVEVNTDASIGFLALNNWSNHKLLLSTTSENCIVDFIHWKRGFKNVAGYRMS